MVGTTCNKPYRIGRAGQVKIDSAVPSRVNARRRPLARIQLRRLLMACPALRGGVSAGRLPPGVVCGGQMHSVGFFQLVKGIHHPRDGLRGRARADVSILHSLIV